VGAVIVKAGRVLAKGWHRCAGGPHAEIEALRALGKTGACTRRDALCDTGALLHARTHAALQDAIVQAGLSRVVTGANRSKSRHTGRGFTVLRKAGVEVSTGVSPKSACN